MNSISKYFIALLIGLCFVLNVFGQNILISEKNNVTDKPIPKGVVFHHETHRQLHVNGSDGHGDNFCQTWAADGNIYSFCDDGYGWTPRNQRANMSGYSCRIWRITGDVNNRGVIEIPNQPKYLFPTKWYGFGIISVDSILYGTVTHVGGSGKGWSRPFNGFKLMYSPDFGTTWHLHDGRKLEPGESSGLSRSMQPEDNFIWQEDPVTITDSRGADSTGFAFTSVYPVQCGQDNSLSQDNYIYWYAPDVPANRLNLARVHKNHIRDRSKWEFFKEWNGINPVWISDIKRRGTVLEFPQQYKDWVAAWRGNKPSVVYNPGLKKYIMINWIEYKSAYWDRPRLHDEMGVKSYAMGLYYSDNPYGPWTEFFWEFDFKPGGRDYSIYHPQLSPKWISNDGKTMIMVFTSRSSFGTVGRTEDYAWPDQTDYAWNEMKLTIITE